MQGPAPDILTILVSDLVSSLCGAWQDPAAALVTTAVPSVDHLPRQRCSGRDIVGGSVRD